MEKHLPAKWIRFVPARGSKLERRVSQEGTSKARRKTGSTNFKMTKNDIDIN